MKRWTEKRIREYIESHDENDTTPHDDLVAMFRAVYGRKPDEDDIREGLWSHICAGVSHDGSGRGGDAAPVA